MDDFIEEWIISEYIMILIMIMLEPYVIISLVNHLSIPFQAFKMVFDCSSQS